MSIYDQLKRNGEPREDDGTLDGETILALLLCALAGGILMGAYCLVVAS